jgi:hypothetical protein
LTEAAAEARTGKIEIVSEDVEKRRGRFNINRVPLPVDEKSNGGHRAAL